MPTVDIPATSNCDVIQSDGSATYSVVRAGNSLSMAGGATDMRVGQGLYAGPEYAIWQSMLEFDFSALGGATINSAVFKLAPSSGDDSATDFVMRLRDYDYGTVEASDFVAGASLSATGSLRAHYDTSGGWTPNGTFIPFSDDALAAYVTAEAGTFGRFVLYSSHQEANTAPTTEDYIYFAGYSEGVPPTITVDYTPAAGPGPSGRRRGGALHRLR